RLFPVANTPQKLVALGVKGLEPYIRSIGLYPTKAKNVIELSRLLVANHGGEVPPEPGAPESLPGAVPLSREALRSLPGGGRKTANVVLNTGFGQTTVAVDTHIFRVANRTGI